MFARLMIGLIALLAAGIVALGVVLLSTGAPPSRPDTAKVDAELAARQAERLQLNQRLQSILDRRNSARAIIKAGRLELERINADAEASRLRYASPPVAPQPGPDSNAVELFAVPREQRGGWTAAENMNMDRAQFEAKAREVVKRLTPVVDLADRLEAESATLAAELSRCDSEVDRLKSARSRP